MKGLYAYEQRPTFPHMGPEDVLVWRRFIDVNPGKYTTVDYDIKIGTVPAFVSRDEAGIGGNIANLYLRKIDVVGFVDDFVDIIEVKPKANFSTVGQILGYLMHWRSEHGDVAKVYPKIVCGEAPLDVRILAEQSGVEIFVV